MKFENRLTVIYIVIAIVKIRALAESDSIFLIGYIEFQ